MELTKRQLEYASEIVKKVKLNQGRFDNAIENELYNTEDFRRALAYLKKHNWIRKIEISPTEFGVRTTEGTKQLLAIHGSFENFYKNRLNAEKTEKNSKTGPLAQAKYANIIALVALFVIVIGNTYTDIKNSRVRETKLNKLENRMDSLEFRLKELNLETQQNDRDTLEL